MFLRIHKTPPTMKNNAIMICAIALFCCLGAKAQDPFKDLYIYAYDNATKKLYMIDQELLGLGDDIRGEVTFALPLKGKDIDVCIINGSEKIQKKLVWNGKGFNLSK